MQRLLPFPMSWLTPADAGSNNNGNTPTAMMMMLMPTMATCLQSTIHAYNGNMPTVATWKLPTVMMMVMMTIMITNPLRPIGGTYTGSGLGHVRVQGASLLCFFGGLRRRSSKTGGGLRRPRLVQDWLKNQRSSTVFDAVFDVFRRFCLVFDVFGGSGFGLRRFSTFFGPH